MLQRGLLTNAEQQQHYHQQQQQQQTTKPPYDVNLSREQQHLSNMSNSQNINEENKERINCLPIIEMPQIKIEQDMEYMEGIEEEEQHDLNKEANDQAVQYEKEREEPMEVEDEGQEMIIKPVPQLLEPTSILKTSLLTGAANTLATLTAAAEQIARMPSEENLIKNYSSYYKEENKRSYTIEEEGNKDQVEVEEKKETIPTTYTSILQTALMSKRPATLNVAATCSATSNSGNTNKSLHVRTPDQVLKTAVTLASLGEIAAQQEQQQQQQMQQQQPHILVVPQVSSGPRKMCTLPFKKLNFANVTTSATSSAATCLNNTASLATATTATATLAETTTTITNNYLNIKLKQNLNINTNNLITNNTTNCSINCNKQAASNTTTNITNTETTTATFFDTNKFKNNVATICSTSSNSNIQCSTLKIPCIKPLLVTTQTQTEEANNTNSSTSTSLTTASSLQTTGGNSTNLLRTAVLANSKLPTQNSLQTSLQTPKFPLKTKILDSFKAATNVAESTVVSNIYKHVSANSSNSNCNTNNSLSNLNIIKNQTKCSSILQNLKESENTEEKPPQTSTANSTAQNVTVVVFETLLPED